jgi:hypothetical protein
MASMQSRKIKYSKADMVLLSLLNKRKSISSVELADKFYTLRPPRPRTARQSVVSMMSSLIENVDINKEPFQIIKSPRRGPSPGEYRKVKR